MKFVARLRLGRLLKSVGITGICLYAVDIPITRLAFEPAFLLLYGKGKGITSLVYEGVFRIRILLVVLLF